MVVSRSVAKCVTNFEPISERMLLLQINANPANINILQVYAPITDQKSDNEVIKFYSKIIEALKKLPKKDLIITMGDFNATVGQGRSGNRPTRNRSKKLARGVAL